MKSLLTLAAVMGVVLAVTGCKSPGIFATSFDDGKKDMVVLDSSPIFPANLSVTNFKDLRPADNTSGTVLWSLCPLMPFGWVDYSRPENGNAMMNVGNYQYNLVGELARAVAVSFDTSRLFNSAYAVNDIDHAKGNLILDAEIYTTRFDGKLISYCISVASPALWVIGLPATHLRSSIDMKLRISHRSTGKVVWEYPVKMEDSSYRWAYGRTSEEIQVYCKMVRQALNKAIPELEKRLSANPNLLNDKLSEEEAQQQLKAANVELKEDAKEQQEVKEQLSIWKGKDGKAPKVPAATDAQEQSEVKSADKAAEKM